MPRTDGTLLLGSCSSFLAFSKIEYSHCHWKQTSQGFHSFWRRRNSACILVAKVISGRLWLLERLTNGWYCVVCVKSRFHHYWIIFSCFWLKSIMRAIQLDIPNLTTKVEILSATLYKFFKIANFNVSPKHDDQEILLCITFFRNVPIHISWV